MSKTQLTLQIEEALRTYKPARLGVFELNYRRRQYKDYEVPVTHSHITDGIVDCLWLVEGFVNKGAINCCTAPTYLKKSSRLGRKHTCGKAVKELVKCEPCDNECFYNKQIKQRDEGVAIICFEIKTSVTDFKSPHGHNFIGSLNYYVMPFSVYGAVKHLIPEDIGVITYHSNKEGRLMHRVPSVYKEINQPLYNSLLHTFLDRADKRYDKFRKDVSHILYSRHNVYYKLLEQIRDKALTLSSAPECFEIEKGKYCKHSAETHRCKDCLYSFLYVNNVMKKLKDDKRTEKLLGEYML